MPSPRLMPANTITAATHRLPAAPANVYYPSQRLKSTTVSAGASKTITYQYNGALLVSSMQVTGESAFSYSYNGNNQLDSVTNPNSVTVSFPGRPSSASSPQPRHRRRRLAFSLAAGGGDGDSPLRTPPSALQARKTGLD